MRGFLLARSALSPARDATPRAPGPTGTIRRSWSRAAPKLRYSALESDLVDAVWPDKPVVEARPVRVHPLRFAGTDAAAKLLALRGRASAAGASAVLLTALDDVAWTLNLRGGDIDYNPVFMSYLLVHAAAPEAGEQAAGATLFVDEGKLGPEGSEVRLHLQAAGVAVAPYEAVLSALRDLPASTAVLADGATASVAVARAVPGRLISASPSPVALPRALKNGAELGAMWDVHVRDAGALCRYFAWCVAARSLRTGRGGDGTAGLARARAGSGVSARACAALRCTSCQPGLATLRSPHAPGGRALTAPHHLQRAWRRRLERAVLAGEALTECDVAQKLLQLRREEAGFVGPSFETISSVGPNAAIIHYAVRVAAVRARAPRPPGMRAHTH